MGPDRAAAVKIPLGFGRISATVGDHIAHFYKGFRQRFGVLGPYVAEGLRRGDRCVVICTPEMGRQLCRWLEAGGLDAEGARREGLLVLHPGETTKEDMKALADRLERESLEGGYKFVRWAGDMAWGVEAEVSVFEMLRWEALYDQCSTGWQMCALCQFDLDQFGGDVVMNALRSHPLCIMGEVLVPNPLHIPPDALLQQLSEHP